MKALIVLAFLTSTNAFAIECPKLKLSCEQYNVLPNRSEFITKQEIGFTGMNDDEPSLPANKCNANLTFKLPSSLDTLNVSVYEDLQTYLYVEEGFGARDPQFSLVAQPNQEFQMYYNHTRLVCRLK